MAAYWKAKRALFAWPGLKAAVLNVDDPHGAAGRDAAAGALWTCGPAPTEGRRGCGAEGLHHDDGGLAFALREGDAQCCRCAAR
jgi:UDP-N-acetylmuramyl tripeptide synthase